MNPSKLLYILLLILPVLCYAQSNQSKDLYVNNIDGDTIKLLSINYPYKSIYIIANTLACSVCLINITLCLDSFIRSNTKNNTSINLIMSIGDNTLEQRQQIIFFNKKSKVLNVYFDIINYDSHLSYRNPKEGYLKRFNTNGNPVLLLVDSKTQIIELINYSELFNETLVSETAKTKILAFITPH